MKIASWNVNGIRAIAKKGFLEWLKKSSFDIVCLQETKASPEQLTKELLHPPGYQSYWCSAEKKGYSGVAFFSKTKLQCEHGIGIKKFDSEGRIISTDLGKKIKLLNIYFPNGKKNKERLKYKLDFYDAVLNHCQKLRKQGFGIIITGDVNTAHTAIDLARPKQNENVSGFLPIERKWIDKLLASGYLDTFRLFNQEPSQYTWWDYKTGARQRNIGWRIDYFFVSDELKSKIKNCQIHAKIMGSDHCPLSLEIK